MSLNIIASQVTKSERWLKLYRMIHHLFLKDEFVHIEDYNKAINELNQRITTVEANAKSSVEAAVLALQAAIVGHFHMVPQSTSGVLPSGPGSITAPPVVTFPPVAPLVIPVTVAMQRTDLALMATGPAQAPLADGIAPDQTLANTTIISDIGA